MPLTILIRNTQVLIGREPHLKDPTYGFLVRNLSTSISARRFAFELAKVIKADIIEPGEFTYEQST